MAEAVKPAEETTPPEEVDQILEDAVADLVASADDTTAEPAEETTAEETVEETVAAEPADVTPAPAAPAPAVEKPTATPVIESAEVARFRPSKDLSERIVKNRESATTLKAKIAKGEFSAVDDAGEAARIQLESLELREELDGQRDKHNEGVQYWNNFAAANPSIGVKQGQKMYSDAYTAIRTRFPDWSDAQVAGGAAIAWENALERVRTASPAPATPKKPVPVAVARAPVIPPKTAPRAGFAPRGGTGAPKPKAPIDPADEFAKQFAKSGLDISALTGG